MNVEAGTAEAVQNQCSNGVHCDACSIAISRIYKTYEVYLNNLFAETFKTHSEAMFNKLHEANLALETAANNWMEMHLTRILWYNHSKDRSEEKMITKIKRQTDETYYSRHQRHQRLNNWVISITGDSTKAKQHLKRRDHTWVSESISPAKQNTQFWWRETSAKCRKTENENAQSKTKHVN